MNRRGKLYIILTILAVLTIVYLEMSKPKEINWFPSYVTHHKIPFGSTVAQKILKRQNANLAYINRPPFEYLQNSQDEGTYLLYNHELSFDNSELETILDWVKHGNTLFLASNNLQDNLLDSLNLETKTINTVDTFKPEYKVSLVNPNLNSEVDYLFDKSDYFNYFNKIDTLKTTVLGYIKKTSKDEENKDEVKSHVNFIKQSYGDGEIILSLFPQSFTNYFILEGTNFQYTANMLSYLSKDDTLLVDEYYKSGKEFYTSPLYLFLSNPSLKWAYYTILIAVVVYIIFEAKRKQRAIPIIKPLNNQTLAFSRTISDMYYHDKKHKKIAHHLIVHFLEYIRRQFYLNTDSRDQEFLVQLSERSNNSLSETEALFNYIRQIEDNSEINEEALKKLHDNIQTFKDHNQWKIAKATKN